MLPKEKKSFYSSKISFFVIILLVYTGLLPLLDTAWTKIMRAVLFRNSDTTILSKNTAGIQSTSDI